MFEQVTPQYIKFIKQYLCQRLYSKFINIGYTKNMNDEEEIINELLSPSIWNDIFKEEYIILKYYLQLISVYPDESITNNSLPVYESETFQEYIDRRVNLQSIGSYQYQEFIKNMKDETFHRNMIKKYEDKEFLHKVKNHLIYVIKLYIKISENPTIYMTEEESNEIDTFLDMTSFFKYIRSNNWVDHTQCFQEELQNKIEADAMKLIYESIYN
jgi:hypothetical protein